MPPVTDHWLVMSQIACPNAAWSRSTRSSSVSQIVLPLTPGRLKLGAKPCGLKVSGALIVAGYRVLLPDLVHLTLGEQAEDSLDRQILRRADAQLVAPLGVVAVSDHELLWIRNERARGETGRWRASAVAPYSVCLHVVVTGLSQPVTSRPKVLVVEVGVVAVVRDRVLVADEPAAGIGDVEVADLALDRERGLRETSWSPSGP